MKFNPNQIVRKCDFQRHTKCNPDLIIGSVKCFDLYIFLLVFISKDLGYKQICWTILVNLCPTSGTVWRGVADKMPKLLTLGSGGAAKLGLRAEFKRK